LEDLIENIAVLIDRPPQPTLAAADGDDDLVEMPDVAATRHSMGDDRRRKPMALVADGWQGHAGVLHGFPPHWS
jgi:hypothetical protein